MQKFFIICLVMVVFSPNAFSSISNNSPFRSSYLGLSLSIHEPAPPTDRDYQAPNHNGSGPAKVGIKYLHILPGNWQSGFEFNFKEFAGKDGNKSLVIAAITHKVGYSYRLDFPIYLVSSFKASYLSPAQTGVVPYKRDESLAIEVGAGITAELIYVYNPYVLLSAELHRWRGTGSKKYQGYELIFSALWALEYN